MSKAELEAIAARHGLTVDPGHAGAGKFRDLEVGCGAPYEAQHAFIADLKKAGVSCRLCGVNNKDHPQYGQNYVEVPSFWFE